MRYKYRIIDFLATKNVVEVTNENEFNQFIQIITKMGLKGIFGQKTSFQDWQHLANINLKNPNKFYFEYDNARGLTWYDNKREPVTWYGVAPIKVDDLLDCE